MNFTIWMKSTIRIVWPLSCIMSWISSMFSKYFGTIVIEFRPCDSFHLPCSKFHWICDVHSWNSFSSLQHAYEHTFIHVILSICIINLIHLVYFSLVVNIEHIHGWGFKKEWPIKNGRWRTNLNFHNVYKYYNHSFFLVFTIKILSS